MSFKDEIYKKELKKIRLLIDCKRLKVTAVATIVFMLASYMYAYTNGSFLYDNINFYKGPTPIKISSDKWAGIFLGFLDSHVKLPWFGGILAIVFMIVSVYCIIDLLEVKKTWSICLIAGLCSTQSSIVSQQQYIGTNYIGEVALAFACMAVWILVRLPVKMGFRLILTASCIAISAGIYGSYVSMVPSLLILLLIMDIVFREKSAKETWRKAWIYFALFLVGMILYYIILRAGVYLTHSQLQSYAGQDRLGSIRVIFDMVGNVRGAYAYILKYYLGRLEFNFLPDNLSRLLLWGMIFGIMISAMTLWRRKGKIRDFKYNILLLFILVLILPVSLNLIYIMSSGVIHWLMIFTYALPYLFFVKEAEMCVTEKSEQRIGYATSMIFNLIMCIFLYYSVVMANAVCVQLNHLYVSAQSIGTRIIDRIESCEGFDGTEKVYFFGAMQNNDYFRAAGKQQSGILNANLGPGNINFTDPLGPPNWCVDFLKYVLDSKLQYSYYLYLGDYEITENVDSDIMGQLREMSVYPAQGSVQKIGDCIYVVFSYDAIN